MVKINPYQHITKDGQIKKNPEPIVLFSVGDVEAVLNKITHGINAPFVSARSSTMTGIENVSILFVVSLEKKEDWVNGYIENSRYARFHLYRNGVLEQFSGSFSKLRYEVSAKGLVGVKIKNFRKTKVKSVDEAIAKINKYIQETNDEYVRQGGVPNF